MTNHCANQNSVFTFGSLFAGIGGIDLGLERAGMVCKWQVEKEPFANRVLEKHWPDVVRHDDVCTFPPTESETWNVDLIAGGFPCQDISNAGKRKGLKGERSGLFYEVMRIAQRIRPRYLLLENVAALLIRGMGEVLRELAAIGFDAEWHCVPAASVGAPHRRDRVFIVAYADGERAFRGKPEDRSRGGAISRSQEKKGYVADTNGKRLQGQRQLGEAGEVFTQEALGVFSGRIGKNQWGIEPNVGRVANGVPHRVDRLRGLGNAVVPQVAQFIGEIIMDRERK